MVYLTIKTISLNLEFKIHYGSDWKKIDLTWKQSILLKLTCKVYKNK